VTQGPATGCVVVFLLNLLIVVVVVFAYWVY
jgi:hypothetical protein